MLTYLQKLRDERDSLSATSSGILENAASENRSATDVERASIDKMAQRCAAIDDELKTFTAQYESQRAYAALREKLEAVNGDPPKREVEKRAPRDVEVRSASWGDIFVTSQAFKDYDGHGSTRRVDVPGLFTRAPIESDSNYGATTPPKVVQTLQPSETTPLLAAVGHIATNQLTVQWLNTQPVPEAGVVPEGDLKPEAAIDVTPQTGTLQTYAHWAAVTRQALANIPLIRSVIESQLRAGIFKKLETDINTALGAATLDNVTYDPANPDAALAAIRQAIGEAQANGFPNATSVVLNPADWAALDLAVMYETVNGASRQSGFWGLAPVASAAIPAGTMYVGDVKNGISVFEMGSAAVFMSDSHADYFVRNTLVVLAECMALPMVTQARALVKVTATVAP